MPRRAWLSFLRDGDDPYRLRADGSGLVALVNAAVSDELTAAGTQAARRP